MEEIKAKHHATNVILELSIILIEAGRRPLTRAADLLVLRLYSLV
jgi:hypothetical protein